MMLGIFIAAIVIAVIIFLPGSTPREEGIEEQTYHFGDTPTDVLENHRAKLTRQASKLSAEISNIVADFQASDRVLEHGEHLKKKRDILEAQLDAVRKELRSRQTS